MKIFFTTFTFLSLTCAIVAQPVISRNQVIAPGDEIFFVNVEDVPGPGMAGAGVHWDFGDVVPDPDVIRMQVADPDTTPYFDDFPNANLALIVSSPVAQVYQYQMINSNAWEEHGSVVLNFTTTIYQNPATYVQFPMTFNSEWQDDFSYTTQFNFNPVLIMGEGEADIRVDGYGSLTLPHTTFDDVLRLRIVENSVDTSSLGQGLSERNDHYDTTFVWFSPSYPGPLATHSHGKLVTTVYLVSGDTVITDQEMSESMSFTYDPMSEPTSAVKDYVKPGQFQLNISPNPFGRVLNLSFVIDKPRDMQFVLRDLQGRTIYVQSMSASVGENRHQVNLSPIPAGTYIALLRSPDGADVQKLIRLNEVK